MDGFQKFPALGSALSLARGVDAVALSLSHHPKPKCVGMKKEKEENRTQKAKKSLSTCWPARSWQFKLPLAWPNAYCSKEMYAGSQHGTQRVLGHDPGAEEPQVTSAVIGGDRVHLTDNPRCLQWCEEHALSCSMELVALREIKELL